MAKLTKCIALMVKICYNIFIYRIIEGWHNMSKYCELVEELRKLKKSSLEAVDSEKEFSAFKQYMHIHRKVEDDLISTIKLAKSLPGKCLILVCGNVGDGKSHLISYLNKIGRAHV